MEEMLRELAAVMLRSEVRGRERRMARRVMSVMLPPPRTSVN